MAINNILKTILYVLFPPIYAFEKLWDYFNRKSIVIIGPVVAGKTSIISILKDGKINKDHNATNTTKHFNINGANFTLIDTSGVHQEAFFKSRQNEINKLKDNDILLYVFDGTKYSGDQKSELWLDLHAYRTIAFENDKKLAFKVIGTRKRQVEQKGLDIHNLENDIRSNLAGVQCKFFELVDDLNSDDDIKNLQKEILEFLKD